MLTPIRSCSRAEDSEPAQHRQRRVQRALGVILQRGGRAERGHDRIAGELLDRPAGALDLRRHRVVEAVEDDARPLGILLAELGRADEVGEEDGRELPLLARSRRLSLDRCAAGGAEPRIGRDGAAAGSAGQRAFTS